MATTAHAKRLTIHAVAPMATVVTNVRHIIVSDLTKCKHGLFVDCMSCIALKALIHNRPVNAVANIFM